VFLRCEVRARPPLTSIYWLIDDNNTVVMDGESVGDYRSLDMVRVTVQPQLPAVSAELVTVVQALLIPVPAPG